MGIAVLNVVLALTVFPRLWPGSSLPLSVVAGSAAVISLLVYLYTRYSKSDPAVFVTLGLVYEVMLAAALAVLDHTPAFGPVMTSIPLLSRAAFVIFIFAAVVPSTPRRTAIAAVIAASMDPLAMTAAMATGRLQAPPSHILLMHFPNYLAAGIAVVISHIITRLGREVRDARDLGSYRLGAMIGRGGMGEVYHATHRLMARPAAIKLIRRDILSHLPPEHARVAIDRFRREAEAAARLRSPHTIELYDFGVSDTGVFYYVMELLYGVDLEVLVERFGPVPPERAVHLLRQACDSLSEAHAEGLMHRDIKPSNIYACRMGLVVDFVKLLDFGLVKPRAENDGNGLKLTTVGNTPGTPAYMAPEALLGDQEPDHRADIYALGCVGYWLLTGACVFDATTLAQLLRQHLEGRPLPPSRRGASQVPPALDSVIMGCLAKEPSERPSSTQELSELLASCPTGTGWNSAQAAEWWDKHLPRTGPAATPVPVNLDLTLSVARSSATPERDQWTLTS
jgi:serine/threonine-protein kinase